MSTAIAIFFLVGGTGLILVTSIGVLTFPDVYTRMHAATKTTTVGLAGIFVGAAILHGSLAVAVKLGLAAVFLLATQPVAVHLLARSAHRAGVPLWEGTAWDELRDHRDATGRRDDG